MDQKSFLKLISSIALCLFAGGIGSFFTASAVTTWYVTLKKPPFNPPSWIFGPVWTILYILMGIALYFVWTKRDIREEKVRGIQFFFAQLVLNILWSFLFFGLKSPLFALLEIIVLWLMIYATINAFRKVSQVAAWLLIPYLLWVSFATILNASIVVLNR